MNVLLLGNGFDLHHKLPTKYINFLNVVNYLSNNPLIDVQYVGQIFSKPALQNEDKFIKECYMTYKDILDKTPVDMELLTKIITLMDENKWFKYLWQTCNKNIGWIDFEKEMAYVLQCFQSVIPDTGTTVVFGENIVAKYIVEIFDFMLKPKKTSNIATIGMYKVKDFYCKEYPYGSGNEVVDIDKIADELQRQLDELAEALKIYLKCFVDNVSEVIQKEGKFETIKGFNYVGQVISFNYTNTFEIMYSTDSVFHLHGNVNENIILGVNPDKADDVESVDTSFVRFKKYFQRVQYNTNYEYLRWYGQLKSMRDSYRLVIMGHSLDVTDKDVLIELFESAKEIIIFYHEDSVKLSYISNLVSIFGKEGLDVLRREKKLVLLSTSNDMNGLTERLRQEEYELLRQAKIMEDINNSLNVI